MKYNIKPVEEMSIDELIGQVIMVGIPGTILDEKYKEFIKDYNNPPIERVAIIRKGE